MLGNWLSPFPPFAGVVLFLLTRVVLPDTMSRKYTSVCAFESGDASVFAVTNATYRPFDEIEGHELELLPCTPLLSTHAMNVVQPDNCAAPGPASAAIQPAIDATPRAARHVCGDPPRDSRYPTSRDVC
jgi:hypothetical protein